MHTRVYRYDLTYTFVKGNKHRNDTVIQEKGRVEIVKTGLELKTGTIQLLEEH